MNSHKKAFVEFYKAKYPSDSAQDAYEEAQLAWKKRQQAIRDAKALALAQLADKRESENVQS